MNDFIDNEEIRKRKDNGPYDKSLEENISMYDKQIYIRDLTLCNTDTLGLVSGNVIKYYRCNIGDIKKILN